MSYQYPDRISIEESDEVEVAPEYAILEVVIEGESSVFGNEAIKKSKEIARFVSDLESINYDSKNISLENISIETSTGKLIKSSMAKFTLNLDKIELDSISKILGIISNQKNIEIQDMEYYFGNLNSQKSELLRKACIASRQQAQEVCAALDSPLISVYSMTPKWTFPDENAISQNHGNSGLRLSKSRSTPKEKLEGLDFSANFKRKLRLLLKIDFRVGTFQEPNKN